MRKQFVILSFIFFAVLTMVYDVLCAERKLEIDSLRIRDEVLLVDLHADGLINDKIVEGLERGLISMVEYRIQLWRRKSLVSQLVEETYYRVKLYFDHWENKFAIISEQENRLTSSRETLHQKCSEVKNLIIADKNQLQPATKYYVTVKMKFEPITTENYEQLRTWIQGEMGTLDPSDQREPPKESSGSRGRIFNVFINLLGFGDKILSVKTGYFTVASDSLTFLK